MAKNLSWASCSCWLTDNIFLKRQNWHVKFIDAESFTESYSGRFLSEGYSKEDINQAIEFATKEVKKRENSNSETLSNKVNNIINYKPLNINSFVLNKKDFCGQFLENINSYFSPDRYQLNDFIQPLDGLEDVYRFPILSEQCLERLNSELDNFQILVHKKSRPNTMNNSGVVLAEIPGSSSFVKDGSPVDFGGADVDLMESMFSNGLRSILNYLFQDLGNKLDSYRLFTVEYGSDFSSKIDSNKDYDLAAHYDNSEITVNICLKLHSSDAPDLGGQLYFVNPSPFSETPERIKPPFAKLITPCPGWAIVHRGCHIHGVLPFDTHSLGSASNETKVGYRRSLICWLRSSSVRSKYCPRCLKKPILIPMKVWCDGKLVDSDKLNNKDLVVRSGFADGMILSQSSSHCVTF